MLQIYIFCYLNYIVKTMNLLERAFEIFVNQKMVFTLYPNN